jgi:hypothetical protein
MPHLCFAVLLTTVLTTATCSGGAGGPAHSLVGPSLVELLPFNEQGWNTIAGNGWSYLRRASSRDDEVIADDTAPFSPPDVLQIVFTPDMVRDHEPSVHWVALPQVRELKATWWMKLSPNWSTSPAGGGKISFAWAPDGEGQVYSNIGGSSAPHRININTEWAPYGQNFWEPNVTATPITYGQWYRVEWYMKWESRPGARDGIIRWWVNGRVNGDYRNVRYPACCFQQFEFAPTRQNPPRAVEYLYIDHTELQTGTLP